MTVYCEPHAQRHRVARVEADRRVVVAVCGHRIALIGHPKHRPAVRTRCPECFR